MLSSSAAASRHFSEWLILVARNGGSSEEVNSTFISAAGPKPDFRGTTKDGYGCHLERLDIHAPVNAEYR
jgi:hypothetical protein